MPQGEIKKGLKILANVGREEYY